MEFATLDRVDRFNHRRILEPNGNRPPQKPKRRTLAEESTRLWPRDASKTASGIPGAVQDALGVLCATLAELDDQSALAQFRTTICESVDGVLLSLVDAMESDDRVTWDIARQPTGERGEMMREIRTQLLNRNPPLRRSELINVLLITNSVEEAFILFSKIEKEFNPSSIPEDYVPQA